MANVTLILCRTPLQEFKYGHRSGRWGQMAVVSGGKVVSGNFLTAATAPDSSPSTLAGQAFGLIDMAADIGKLILSTVAGKTVIGFAGRALELQTEGDPIEVLNVFDTMERFRTDSDRSKFYMQVRPRPASPYRLTMYVSSTVQKLNKTGKCLRVHGHGYKQQGSGETAGILVHEAPHVGWLIGCISPREKNSRVQGENREPSRKAMDFIFDAMGGFHSGQEAQLLVLDW